MDIVVLQAEAAVLTAGDIGARCPADRQRYVLAVASRNGDVVGHLAVSARDGLRVLDLRGDDGVASRLVDALYPLARGGLVWATPDPAQVALLERLGWAAADHGRTALVCPRTGPSAARGCASLEP